MQACDSVILVVCLQAGTYLPQSYLVREQMMVTGKVEHVDQLGYFIYGLCRGRDTYKLERRETVFGKHTQTCLASIPLVFRLIALLGIFHTEHVFASKNAALRNGIKKCEGLETRF